MANETASVLSVSFIRNELLEILPIYDLIRDCLKGEYAVKLQGDKYLPRPNVTDISEDNKKRYDQYVTRAVFYNVTRRTMTGLVGQIFLREPIIELPEELEPMRNDANGETLTLSQLAKQTCGYGVPYGRAGLLSDFPSLAFSTSREQVLDGTIKPSIKAYAPWDIINWRTINVQAKKVLTLLVLQELYDENLNEYQSEARKRYRVYSLSSSGECTLRVFVENTSNHEFQQIETQMIRDGKGVPLREIPFDFVGSENNDSDVDYPPAYDMAIMNLAHYRNSADYEESCFICGQPTPVFTGLTKDWLDSQMKGVVQLGSRAAVSLPVDADASLLQAAANMLVHEAMEQKHKQMVALGARLVEQRKVDRTATEAEIDSASESSVLTDIARNVENGIITALKRCARFVNADESAIKFELNKNFDLTSLMAEEIRWITELSDKNYITWSEFRECLRRSGIAKLPDQEAMDKIIEELEFKKKIAPVDESSTTGSSQSKKKPNQ